MTSQRHDFVSKCLETQRQRANGPKESLGKNWGGGECAMKTKTTTAEAYIFKCKPDGRRPLARPSTASWSQGPNLRMANETETNSRYKKWSPLLLSRPQPPPAYCRSNDPVNGRTVYTASYRPPGSFRYPLPGEQPPVDGYMYKKANEGDIKEQPFYPRAHDYNLYPINKKGRF
ncbi:uncharacterized protein LOC112592784 [Melanaphis sacchari]|uniref:uncharacterized protein LOC112592784 n=1 Tax=Melanaphis sacchari TaxID=742174 RepID=UPI000DC13CD2|nr:uncharacterized protein LOC112592784 [Melanaphis sacchari]